MLHQLISHSPDLKQLRDEGYELELKGGYLFIHHIPYVNSNREIKFGSLVSELTLANPTTTSRPNTHAIYFIGEKPCNKDGIVINEILNSSGDQQLAEGVRINHFFSSKPQCGYYSNYYEKVTSYIEILSAHARVIDNRVTAATFKPILDNENPSVFKYTDTNSSRANIGQMNSKFAKQKIAIIGLGGTGAYILDLVAKTPVQEIHLFDGDDFLQHNAFRSPGAASIKKLEKGIKKVFYYEEIYAEMHNGIIPHDEYITEENVEFLSKMSYVFICVDKNSGRNNIFQSLIKFGIPFIDVGLGVSSVEDKLIGTIRVTSGSSLKNDHLNKRIPQDENDHDNNEYATNIQIADLNSLNAVLAVIKWKKMSGFYQDLKEEYHCTYSINTAQLLNDDLTA